jgi:hypothetical protein
MTQPKSEAKMTWHLFDKLVETIESERGDEDDGEVLAALMAVAAQIHITSDLDEPKYIATTKRLFEGSLDLHRAMKRERSF